MGIAKFIYADQGLVLKAVGLEDGQAFFVAISENQSHFLNFDFSSPNFSSVSEVEQVIQSLMQYRQQEDGASYGAWLENKLVGFFTINKIDWSLKTADLGYWLVKSATGRGLAITGLKSLIEYCFGRLNLNYITAHVATTNLKSQNVLLKAGFQKQQRYSQNMNVRGQLVDSFEYKLEKILEQNLII